MKNNCNGRRTVDVLSDFGWPDRMVYRAYDHLIAARPGMTLMVPVAATTGRLIPIVDRCPVPWLEASAILGAEYDQAAPLSLVGLVQSARDLKRVAPFSEQVLSLLLGFDTGRAVALADKDWRHTIITLAQGGAPCRVLIGAAGVRLAFTPDFLEGLI